MGSSLHVVNRPVGEHATRSQLYLLNLLVLTIISWLILSFILSHGIENVECWWQLSAQLSARILRIAFRKQLPRAFGNHATNEGN